MTENVEKQPTITRRNLLGAALLAGAAGLAGWALYLTPPAFGGGKLDVAEAHRAALAGEITLIDIRRPDEWQRTGIGEGAHPIDMRRDDFAEALADIVGPDPTVPIALICARGVRSARLANWLTQAGYENILDVPEGMEGSRAGPGWVASGLPVRAFDPGAGS